MNAMISAPTRLFALVLAGCLYTVAAEAQLFGRSDDRAPQGGDTGDLSVRLDRMENQMRQLTGTLEQLQYQNQQLQEQLRAMQQQVNAGGAPRSTPRPPLGAGQGPAPMQPDRSVEPTKRSRCFAQDAGATAARAGGDGEVELRTQLNVTPIRRYWRQTTVQE